MELPPWFELEVTGLDEKESEKVKTIILEGLEKRRNKIAQNAKRETPTKKKLLTKAQIKKLRANFDKVEPLRSHSMADVELKPVVKFFTAWGHNCWLLTELDEDYDTLYGLCDLGLGLVEIGPVSLLDLETTRGPFGLGVERDKLFQADKTLREYFEIAKSLGHIET